MKNRGETVNFREKGKDCLRKDGHQDTNTLKFTVRSVTMEEKGATKERSVP